jgi:hypothetical protein
MTLSYVVLTVLSLMTAVEVEGDPYHLAHSQGGAMPPKRGEKLKQGRLSIRDTLMLIVSLYYASNHEPTINPFYFRSYCIIIPHKTTGVPRILSCRLSPAWVAVDFGPVLSRGKKVIDKGIIIKDSRAPGIKLGILH